MRKRSKLRGHPKRSIENYIGAYEVRTLEVKIGPVEVRFDPIGTNLIGARGRVDLKGPHGMRPKFVLVRNAVPTPSTLNVVVQDSPTEIMCDEPEPDVENWTWKISTRPPNIEFIDLEEEVLSFRHTGSRECLALGESHSLANISNLPGSRNITVTLKHPCEATFLLEFIHLKKRFVGYSENEVEVEMGFILDEHARSTSMSVLAALEASFRIDYLQSVLQKAKGSLVKVLFVLHTNRRAHAYR